MRKWGIAVIIASLFLSLNTTSQASFDGIRLGDFPKNSILYQSINDESTIKNLNQIIVLPKQSFDQKEAAAIITRIGSLPASLLEKINNLDINLKLFTGKLTENPTTKKLAGQTPRGYQSDVTWDDIPGIGGSKVVLVKIGSSEKGKGHGSFNLELHELAHSIDRFVYGEISSSQGFRDVWELEHEQLFPGNSYFLYPEEYFAESFAMYYLNYQTNDLLRTNAPKTFEFIGGLQ